MLCNDINMENENKVLKTYEVKDVKKHATVDDCWVTHGKDVYDVTKFIEKHPGGVDVILDHAGSNITGVLNDENLHVHSVHAYNLLEEYKIGELRTYEKSHNSYDLYPKVMTGFKEDLVDWDQGMLFQVHKFGGDYLKWVHSPVNKRLKLFDSEFCEFFSRTKWYFVPLVWLPVVILSSIFSFGELHMNIKYFLDIGSNVNNILTNISFILLFIIGMFSWTFIEYILHRFLFHIEPRGDSPIQISIHFFFHGLHHKVPFDCDRLVFPPVAALLFVSMFWGILQYFLPTAVANIVFAGGLFGYICYDMIHYYVHHGVPARGTYLHGMKYHHVLHHFDSPSTGFGISTKFWDYPFNTLNKKVA